MGKDYYKVLGLQKSCSDADIKKAYRKLALQHHPDRNKGKQAEEKFKEINFAYSILSDKEKRKRYDQFGEAGINPNAGGGHPNMNDMDFGQFFTNGNNSSHSFSFNTTSNGDFGNYDPFSTFETFFGSKSGHHDPFSGMPGMHQHFGNSFKMTNNMGSSNMGGGSRITGVTQSIDQPLNVTLEELYYGSTRKFKIGRDKKQKNGRYIREDKTFEIQVQPGWKDNTKIRFKGEANEADGKLPGDIIFSIKTKQHNNFFREGDNLIHKTDVTLSNALSGSRLEFHVPLIAGGNKQIFINQQIISPETEIRIANEGLPNSKNKSTRGDLIIRFNIIFPKNLNDNVVRASRLL